MLRHIIFAVMVCFLVVSVLPDRAAVVRSTTTKPTPTPTSTTRNGERDTALIQQGGQRTPNPPDVITATKASPPSTSTVPTVEAPTAPAVVATITPLPGVRLGNSPNEAPLTFAADDHVKCRDDRAQFNFSTPAPLPGARYLPAPFVRIDPRIVERFAVAGHRLSQIAVSVIRASTLRPIPGGPRSNESVFFAFASDVCDIAAVSSATRATGLAAVLAATNDVLLVDVTPGGAPERFDEAVAASTADRVGIAELDWGDWTMNVHGAIAAHHLLQPRLRDISSEPLGFKYVLPLVFWLRALVANKHATVQSCTWFRLFDISSSSAGGGLQVVDPRILTRRLGGLSRLKVSVGELRHFDFTRDGHSIGRRALRFDYNVAGSGLSLSRAMVAALDVSDLVKELAKEPAMLMDGGVALGYCASRIPESCVAAQSTFVS